ncbi:disease resistance protein RPV1-like [Diospyros lotus]|uniref:disease resistance protein RPV1-like n=1 Tax=Diospyros lotus TaxID=55363 RepID=UPI00225B3A61|nr:disease resistance protein RPV1-like [Diospyros lotus]
MAAEAPTSVSRYEFHVFLSFRGEDTRKNFTDYLYTALVNAGFRTFRDDDEIERGANIKIVLETAIQQSMGSVIVLSRDYASSGWCLDELAMIVRCKMTSNHLILPVFYNVNPSDVREQTGNLTESFDEHERRVKAETDERKREELMKKVEGWRAALREVAKLGGPVLEYQSDRHESKFVQIIVQEVLSKWDLRLLNVTLYPTGLESRIKDINAWLQDGLDDVGIMVINGMGGIGKTTIAKTVYNQNFFRFEGSSFLANIRETAKQHNGLVGLQRQLVSDILKWKNERVYSVDQGITQIKDAICHKRVLVILDDVDQLDQVNSFFGMRDWFYPGTKIIITTRHEQLLKAEEMWAMYTVKELSDDEALCLFSWHAFQQSEPIEGYMELSKRVIHHCGGLPLALEVLGSSLSGESVDIWGSELAKLRTHFPEKIHNVLKASYDALDDHEKNLFLDIACFFVGRDKDYTVKILEEYDLSLKVAMQNLIGQGLIKINKDNELMMHRMHRDMGREIIRLESPKEPGKRSRLWDHGDAFNVLREKAGTEMIKGLILNLEEKMDKSANNTKTPQFEGFPTKWTRLGVGNSLKRHCQGLLSWLPILPASTESLSEIQTDLRTDAFLQMHNLKLLELNNVRLTGNFENFPKLRWLHWRGFPLKFIPNDFPLECLVALDMRYSSLEQFSKRPKLLGSLKILDLSYCCGLTNSPDFSQIPNLERLILEYCRNLVEVHESIGELDRLVFLNLKGCENLRKLPKKVFQLKSLKKLILSGCLQLKRLSPDMHKMESLKVLHADGIN